MVGPSNPTTFWAKALKQLKRFSLAIIPLAIVGFIAWWSYSITEPAKPGEATVEIK